MVRIRHRGDVQRHVSDMARGQGTVNGQSCGDNGLVCANGLCTSVAQQCRGDFLDNSISELKEEPEYK